MKTLYFFYSTQKNHYYFPSMRWEQFELRLIRCMHFKQTSAFRGNLLYTSSEPSKRQKIDYKAIYKSEESSVLSRYYCLCVMVSILAGPIKRLFISEMILAYLVFTCEMR